MTDEVSRDLARVTQLVSGVRTNFLYSRHLHPTANHDD